MDFSAKAVVFVIAKETDYAFCKYKCNLGKLNAYILREEIVIIVSIFLCSGQKRDITFYKTAVVDCFVNTTL